jgi:hypothetical protein
MLQPRYSKPSFFVGNPPIRRSLPTGKGFGGSNLNLDFDGELALPLLNPALPIAVSPQSVPLPQQSPLLVEVLKIVGLALWLWCLLGANFFVDRVGAIANTAPQAAGTDRG